MKYIKKFESFTINETQDMIFMPVDPIKSTGDMWGDIWETVGEYVVEESKEWFFSNLKKLVNTIWEGLKDSAEALLLLPKWIFDKIKYYFKKDVDELTIQNTFDVLMEKNKELQTKKSSIKNIGDIFLSILEGIFGANAFTGGFVTMIVGTISNLVFKFDLAAWGQSLGVSHFLTNASSFGFIPAWCIVSFVAMGIIALLREILKDSNK